MLDRNVDSANTGASRPDTAPDHEPVPVAAGSSSRPVPPDAITFSSCTDDPIAKRLARIIEKSLGWRRRAAVYDEWRRTVLGRDPAPFTRLLEAYGMPLDMPDPSILDDRPGRPLVVPSNHPASGLIDPFLLISLLERMGRPYKLVGHRLSARFIPELGEAILPIEFYDRSIMQAVNGRTMRDAVRFAREGYAIVIYPAGSVARSPFVFGPQREDSWKPFVATLVRTTRASVLPVFTHGRNSLAYEILCRFGQTGYNLGYMVEFYRGLSRPQRLSFERIVPFEDLPDTDDRDHLVGVLRQMVLDLAERDRSTAPAGS